MSVLPSYAPPIPEHPTLPVLYLDEMTGGWWPGVSRNCPHCGGLLMLTPPTAYEPGRLAAIQCERDIYEVRATRRPAFVPSAADDQRRKVGRPPGGGTEHEAKHCADCGSRLAYDNKSGRCRPHFLAYRTATAKGRAPVPCATDGCDALIRPNLTGCCDAHARRLRCRAKGGDS